MTPNRAVRVFFFCVRALIPFRGICLCVALRFRALPVFFFMFVFFLLFDRGRVALKKKTQRHMPSRTERHTHAFKKKRNYYTHTREILIITHILEREQCVSASLKTQALTHCSLSSMLTHCSLSSMCVSASLKTQAQDMRKRTHRHARHTPARKHTHTHTHTY